MKTLSEIKRYCKVHKINYQKAKYAFKKGYKADEACKIAERGGLAYKLFYKDMPLKHYCALSGVSYSSVIQKLKKGIDMETAIKTYSSRQHYIYDGMSLADYCRLHHIEYKRVKGQMIGKGFSAKEAIERVKEIDLYGRHAAYMVGKKTLKRWCKDNSVDYGTMQRKMRTMSFKEALASYKKRETKYFVDGESLHKYCKRLGLPYSRTLYWYKKNENIKSGRTARTGLPQNKTEGGEGSVLQPRAGICNAQSVH